MPASSLLALLDDITTLLDDVAVMTKVATQKTAGVLGDDLALNAQQVAGVRAERELPVVWAVAKGSLLNKAILVPTALAISALAPRAVTPLLMVGGAFLCFEGFEKVAHKLLHTKADEAHHAKLAEVSADTSADLVAFERDKIRGAIRTDFILSAEIMAISLGSVAKAALLTQAGVLVGVSLIVTVGVYGIVAGVVKLDDLGLYLLGRQGDGAGARWLRALGGGVLRAAPWLMSALSVAGTVAMFLVGGGILLHGLPGSHALLEAAQHTAASVPALGGVLAGLAPMLLDGLVGLLAGGLLVGGLTLVRRLRGTGAA